MGVCDPTTRDTSRFKGCFFFWFLAFGPFLFRIALHLHWIARSDSSPEWFHADDDDDDDDDDD